MRVIATGSSQSDHECRRCDEFANGPHPPIVHKDPVDESDSVLITVADDGIGLDSQNVNRIFEAVLHNQATGDGDGSLHLSINRGDPRRAHLGHTHIPQGSLFQFNCQ